MQRNPSHPTICTIEKIIDETPTVRTLVFTDNIFANALPGKFAMVWIPGINELPMSIMITKEHGKAAFTVRRHGPSSTGLYDLQVGQKIGIRGPYGNTFDIKNGKIMLVGGGTGLVPLMRLTKFLNDSHDVTFLIGAKTKDEVFFENLADELLANKKHRVIVTTDDGSYGQKGFVTNVVQKLLGLEKFDAVYTCGPELMMYKTVKTADENNVFVQASLERMMKCGVGICGSCCIGSDLVCHDGTIFDGKRLLSNAEFGHSYRNKAGIIQNY